MGSRFPVAAVVVFPRLETLIEIYPENFHIPARSLFPPLIIHHQFLPILFIFSFLKSLMKGNISGGNR